MSRTRIVVWIVLAACALGACDSFEATRFYRFSGRVIDAETKEPLADVPVLISRYTSGKACEIASNKPCGEGYTQVSQIATANDGTFQFEYEVSSLLSSRHELTADPCLLEPADCKYDEVTLRSDGSLTDQLIQVPRSEL